MRPASWRDSLDAFAVLRSMYPAATIVALVDHADKQGDPPDAKPDGTQYGSEDIDEEGYLRELPESHYAKRGEMSPKTDKETQAQAGKLPGETDKTFYERTGFYPREKYVEPVPPVPPG